MSDPHPGSHPEGRDLSSYLDGGLTGRRAGELEEHLASCDMCREELGALRIAKSAVAGLPEADPGPDWLLRMREALAGGLSGPFPRPARVGHLQGRRWRRTRPRLRLTASLAGLAAAVLWLGAWLAPPPEVPVSFQDEVRQHMVQIDEPLADLTSYVVEARYP